ncbi:MAG: O-antigen ligase family protein [Prevotella sp.]
MTGKDNIRRTYTKESGGRAFVLFLLFAIAIYNLCTAGITAFAAVCLLPVLGIFTILAFKYKMFLFYTLMIVNYFLMYAQRCDILFLPTSLHTELIEILLIAVAFIDSKEFKLEYMGNVMLIALLIWVGFCCIEFFNDICGLGMNFMIWFTGIRLMAFQLLYAFIIFCLYISNPTKINKFLILFAALSLFAVYWTWKQKNIGFNDYENRFLITARRTHFVNGIMRYFSVFSDAANFGINMASTSVVFCILTISTKIKIYRILFAITAIGCLWAMFASGTRTAIFCFIAGISVYIFLSKSFKIAIPVTIVFALFVFILAFTKIGEGNNMIRRMRTAFDPNDASKGVRDINKEALAKYMKDAPWGVGIGVEAADVAPYHKLKIMMYIPPDSEYVYIWVRTGIIGITVFIISTLMMFLGACWIVFFRLKSPTARGIGAAFTCAFISLHLGGYANQVLMQFPNIILFYGGLSIVYILPKIEDEWNIWEAKELAKQEERKRLRLEKKRASRV